MKEFLNIGQLILCLTFCILWPSWLKDGYLENSYLIIATFIAAYGGFIAGLYWYIKNKFKWKSWKEIWNKITSKKH
tara:strand:+ start:104 stop:331 length:228 start_codon:yes stop_codon:yes gene_type:complete